MVHSSLKAGFRDNDQIPCQIEEGLFLGSLSAALNKIELQRLNITQILTVATTIFPPYPSTFKYKIIRVFDKEDTNLRKYFDKCFDFIDEAKRKQGGVLVHCRAGRSRSVTIVIAYLMKRRGMSFSQALQHVKSKRPKACPNAGFKKQLQEFEKSLLDAQNALVENSDHKTDELQPEIGAKDDAVLGDDRLIALKPRNKHHSLRFEDMSLI